MSYAITVRAIGLESTDVTDAIPSEENRMQLEEMNDSVRPRKKKPTRTEAVKPLIRRSTAENEREWSEENRQQREHEREMKRLEMEENNNAREHELNLRRQTQEIMKLKLEEDKRKESIKRMDLQYLELKTADNRDERRHKEIMAGYAVETLNAEEEIRRQRKEEKRIMKKEKQAQISERRDLCEENEIQRREKNENQRRRENENDTRSLVELGLYATGAGAATGAIGGALGATATCGLAAGAAVGAAAVLTPVYATVAVLGAAGYVYKKATSSKSA